MSSKEIDGLQDLVSFPVRLGLTWSFPCRPKLKALLKAARNCGFMMPYIIGFAKLLVNIRQATVIKILLGIKHPAVSTITTVETGPHVIKNVQTTVKLVFKSLCQFDDVLMGSLHLLCYGRLDFECFL